MLLYYNELWEGFHGSLQSTPFSCGLKGKCVVHLCAFAAFEIGKTKNIKSFQHSPMDVGVMGYLEFILPHLSVGC